MEKLTQEQLMDNLGQLTIPELVALTKSLEQKWGVSATPQTVAEFIYPGTEIKEVQTEFAIVLKAVSAAAKMNTIKLVREYLNMGLKESKDFVESAPKQLKEGLSKADADDAVAKFTAAGAEVEVK